MRRLLDWIGAVLLIGFLIYMLLKMLAPILPFVAIGIVVVFVVQRIVLRRMEW